MGMKKIGIAVGCLVLGFAAGQSILAEASKTSNPYEGLDRLTQVLDTIEKDYVHKVDRKDLIDGAIKGMIQSLDPHSEYMLPEKFGQFQEGTTGKFFGIGVEIYLENGQVIINSPIDDTPAHKAGLKRGDMIIAVDGVLTQDMSLQEVSNRIRGTKGSSVELTIFQREAKAPVKMTVVRGEIPLISVKAREVEDGYWWVRVSRFSGNTTKELHAALKAAAKNKPIKGIILDMRDNPGGLLHEAVSVSDTFLTEGEIVSKRTRLGLENTGKTGPGITAMNARSQPTDVLAPMVVLINAGSASASEIVAGALQDNSRAVLVGERSFGKGSVQRVEEFASGYALKLTTELYYTPSGRSIQTTGVEPDIYVPFEVTKDMPDTAWLASLREKDLNHHLENDTAGKNAAPAFKPTEEVTDYLKKDNQLRLAIQLVQGLPRLREIR